VDFWTAGPMVWGQTNAVDPDDLPLLALRRWYSSLTLSSPDSAPNRFGLYAWLIGLGALLLISMVVQGPGKALRQLFDVPGHLRLASSAIGRLRRSGRLVAVTLGASVIAWTGSQALSYSKTERLNDLITLKSTKSVREISIEQGVLAALTPLRDVMGLGDNLLLLIGATILAFKLSADRWGSGPDNPSMKPRMPLPPWTTLCWGGTWLYAMYRFATLVVDSDGLPLGSCLFVEAAGIPLLMALSDGLILAWIIVELRKASLPDDDNTGFDMISALPLLPAAALACVLAVPARYVATADFLALQNIPSLKSWFIVRTFLKGWGLVALQGGAVVFCGFAGVVAWRGRSVPSALAGYVQTLRQEGGHLVATITAAGLASAAAAGLAYFIVLALPAQTWVLAAADSYAHYATLPINLLLLAALIELGGRALATPAAPKDDSFS
jgi:hypothetical protein